MRSASTPVSKTDNAGKPQVMPVADALADARQLETFVLRNDRACSLVLIDGLTDAEGFGVFARMAATSLIAGDTAPDFARLAARAAFRAVPALREDR